MDRIINVKINGNHLTKDSRRAGVQHEGNAVSLIIEFDEGWDKYAKTITFWNALGENPVKIALDTVHLEDILASTRIYWCPIPPEAMTEAGELTFVVDGYLETKGATEEVIYSERQRSVSDVLEVIYAPYTEDATNASNPTASEMEQLRAEFQSITATAQTVAVSAKSAAESAESALRSAESARNDAVSAMGSAAAATMDAMEAGRRAQEAAASASAADVSRLSAGVSESSAHAYMVRAEEAASKAKCSEDLAGASAKAASTSASQAARYASDAQFAASQVADVSAKHADVVAKAYQVGLDADRAEAAAKQAEEIAGGDFATHSEVNYAVTAHNADAYAHPIIDTVTLSKYKWGVENGMVYIEEVM